MPRHPLRRLIPQRVTAAQEDGTDRLCTKYAERHKGLTPGVFLVFCPHGICLGYKLMAKFEGPSTAFDLLYSRLKKGVCARICLD